MDANLKQQWYERVTYSKLLAEHKAQTLKEKLKAGEFEQEEISAKYGELACHRATILVTTALFDFNGKIKSHKYVPDLLMNSQLYWDAKALQYWILSREDINAERHPIGNINKQKQAKANSRAFKSWRKKFLKFDGLKEEIVNNFQKKMA